MNVLVAAIGGVVLGVLATYVVVGRRGSEATTKLAAAEATVAANQTTIATLQTQIEQERENFNRQLNDLGAKFQVMAAEALDNVVKSREHDQRAILEQREAKLDERLSPLTTLLQQYKERVDVLERDRVESYQSLVEQTRTLATLQNQSITETNRLNAILGRSSERGRWAENQLENIFAAAGMLKYVDFFTQYSVTVEDGKLRPDAVVALPNGGRVAVDSKAPLAGYDAVLEAETPEARDAAEAAFAVAVKGHVNQLALKAYQDQIQPSPDFTACFIPSDNVLTTALSGDATLWDYALSKKILLVGPSAMMGMLWSVAFGWRNADLTANAGDILNLAVELYNRTAVLYDHFNNLGKSLNSSVKHYNATVGSMESQLLSTVRRIAEHGAKTAKELPEGSPTTLLPRGLTPKSWPTTPALEGAVADADVVDDEE